MKEKGYFNILVLGMIVNLVIGFGIYFYLVLSLLVTMQILSLSLAEDFWIAIDIAIFVSIGVIMYVGYTLFNKDNKIDLD